MASPARNPPHEGDTLKKLTQEDIIRAWRDPDFYRSLTVEQRAALPAHPAGVTALPEAVLDAVNGGDASEGTHDSFCDPTAAWCDDCKDVGIETA